MMLGGRVGRVPPSESAALCELEEAPVEETQRGRGCAVVVRRATCAASARTQRSEQRTEAHAVDRLALERRALGQIEAALPQYALEQHDSDDRGDRHDQELEPAEHVRTSRLDLAAHRLIFL